MAAGLPVVAPAAGGPLEIIDSGRSGLLVPPGDSAALVAAMRRLADDAELRQRPAAAAPAAVAALSPERVARRLREIYDGPVAARRPGLRRLRRGPGA